VPDGGSVTAHVAVLGWFEEHSHPFAFELGNAFIELDGLALH
jgi:hypothetical protein